MKKYVLLGIVSLFAVSAMAQSVNGQVGRKTGKVADVVTNQVVPMNTVIAKPVTSINKQGMAVTIVPTGGTSANAYGLYNGGKTALWADANLNAVAFFHRAPGTPGSGYVQADLSKDGGATWTGNLGPVYSPDNSVHFNARYPQGLIYNPTGNTNPNNAYYFNFSATLDASNGGSWGGVGYGTYKIDSSSIKQGSLTTAGNIYHNVPSGLTVAGGKIFGADASFPTGTFTSYNDTLNVYKGIFNTTTQEFDLTVGQIPFYCSGADSLTTLEKEFPVDVKIAFNPTNPNIGYLGMAAHTSISLVPEEGYYPVVIKTTDGGATWGAPIPVPLKNLGDLVSSSFITDTELNDLFPGLTRPDLWFRTSFEMDLVVDGNGNPHVIVNVFPGDNGRGLTAFSVYGTGDPKAIFDIWSPDGGITWDAKMLGRTMTFRGTFADISEDTRPQAATTPDGSKIFVSWIDTDTNTFVGVTDNINPDIWCVGFDPVNDKVTPVKNITSGTAADGAAYMGTMSEFVFGTTGTYKIPLAYQDFDPAAPTTVATFYYVDGATFTDADFTTSIAEPDRNIVSVSQNYPNPFTGSTSIDVSLAASSNMILKVNNLMGQTVYSKDFGFVTAGRHKVDFGTDLNTGIYTYTVQAGNTMVTKKMIVR
ncbi:MAG TPA: T9SS type A sorting domain-containing protein [Bacteroidales bacterium]|nr:T9SS type A sorting domain-containing protein [Bacteroidales bacterium]HRZ50168.1 T9SS type A sorting domain-containing protein [Bacteroidales bacterium]